MDRRSFFKTTTAAGATLFLPDWITQAENLAEDGRFLPTEVARPHHVLYASASDSGYGAYVLCLDSEQDSDEGMRKNRIVQNSEWAGGEWERRDRAWRL